MLSSLSRVRKEAESNQTRAQVTTEKANGSRFSEGTDSPMQVSNMAWAQEMLDLANAAKNIQRAFLQIAGTEGINGLGGLVEDYTDCSPTLLIAEEPAEATNGAAQNTEGSSPLPLPSIVLEGQVHGQQAAEYFDQANDNGIGRQKVASEGAYVEQQTHVADEERGQCHVSGHHMNLGPLMTAPQLQPTGR